MDCTGAGEALVEAGIVHFHQDLSLQPLTAEFLADYSIVIACDLELTPAESAMLEFWTGAGGGLLATGASGLGLEHLLGLTDIVPTGGDDATDVRFVKDHPATAGGWWSGLSLESPPMPASQMPTIMRHLYFDREWPAWAAAPGDGTVLARWRNKDDRWEVPDNQAVVIAHSPGDGRSVYSGALPGVYANWDWPHSWRTFLISAVEWLATSRGLVEIGYWPHAHRAAFSWTGDTERPRMVTAVPSLLDLFSNLGLERFGTFYVVGKAGEGTVHVGALEHPEVVQAIAAAGSEVGGHGDIHASFNEGPEHRDARVPFNAIQPLSENPRFDLHARARDQSYDQQYDRLQDMRDIINPILEPFGEEVTGFRAPHLSQNRTTFRALADLGFDYDAGEADVWSQTTFPHRLLDVWQLPPTMPMDYNLLEAADLDPAVVEALYLDKLAYVISRRGLFSWLHHPWIIEPHLELVENILRYAIARGDIWMARQDDILKWWIQRESLSVTRIEHHGRRLEIEILNGGTAGVEGASIWIRTPADTPEDWVARVAGQTVPLHRRDHGGGRFMVAVIPPVPAGDSRVLIVQIGDRIFSDRFENETK